MDINNLKLESISVVNIRAYQKVRKYLTDDIGNKENFGIIHDSNVQSFKELIFLCDRLEDRKFIIGLVHEKEGTGYINFKLDNDTHKSITLRLFHNNYDKSYYRIDVGELGAKIPLTTDISLIKSYIKQFVEM